MQIINRLLTKGAEHGRPGTALTPKGVTIHYVGNPGSAAEANRNWFENGAGGANTSTHYIVGLNGEILLCVPENERAQHAGKSYAAKYDAMAKTNNSRYIGIEVCHPDASGKFNDKSYAALVELVAEICKTYKFDPLKDVVRHYDITGKDCPLYYKNNTAAWAKLLNDIGGYEVLDKIKVNINGKVIGVNRILKDGTNFVGLREMGELLGFTVEYDVTKNPPIILKSK